MNKIQTKLRGNFMKKFENNISVNTSLKRVRNVLLNAENLKGWDPEVASIEYKEDRIVSLVRKGRAINSTEHIMISELSNKNSIIYKSFGGIVEYSISFNLSNLNKNTILVHQDVELTKISNKIFQLDDLVLIAKDAFNENLKRLKTFCELRYYYI